jgi:hypothetical protein
VLLMPVIVYEDSHEQGINISTDEDVIVGVGLLI